MPGFYLYVVSALAIFAVTLSFLLTLFAHKGTDSNKKVNKPTVSNTEEQLSNKALPYKMNLPKNVIKNIFGESNPKTTVLRVIFPKNDQSKSAELIFYITPRADATKTTAKDVATKTYNDNKTLCPKTATLIPILSTKVANTTAYSYTVQNCKNNYEEYFLSNGKFIYELSFFHDEKLNDYLLKIEKDILNSFQFIN